MSGHVGDLSPSQERTLAEFKELMSEELGEKHDDYLLLQFLRARRFDIKRTEEMFRRHLQFRKEFPEDYMVNEYEPPELLLKYLLPPLIGYDKGGSPIRIIHIGHQDIKGIVSCFRRPDIRKCVTWFLDTDKAAMRRRSKETGKHVETRTFIFDMDGLSFRQIYHRDVYDLVISFLRLYECNYPENLKVAFIINTPSFFAWLFNMVKSLLTEDTVRKLKIHGYSGWQEELRECIDEDVLPVVYGGKRTDPDGDPRCLTLTNVGGPIPEKYYLKHQKRLREGEEGVRRVQVGRRSKCSLPLRVEQTGHALCWEVECEEGGDIAVSLVFSEGVTPETVVKSTRVNADRGSHSGCHLADRAGKYSLVLDNSYSLLRSKSVLYRTRVSPVDESRPPNAF